MLLAEGMLDELTTCSGAGGCDRAVWASRRASWLRRRVEDILLLVAFSPQEPGVRV